MPLPVPPNPGEKLCKRGQLAAKGILSLNTRYQFDISHHSCRSTICPRDDRLHDHHRSSRILFPGAEWSRTHWRQIKLTRTSEGKFRLYRFWRSKTSRERWSLSGERLNHHQLVQMLKHPNSRVSRAEICYQKPSAVNNRSHQLRIDCLIEDRRGLECRAKSAYIFLIQNIFVRLDFPFMVWKQSKSSL